MIAAAVLLCAALVAGIKGAEQGVYTPLEEARYIVVGSLGILATFGLFGAVLLSIRKRVWIDFEAGTLGTVSEVMGRRTCKELPLLPNGRILCRRREINTAEADKTVWTVEYACSKGELELHSLGSLRQGRAWAERFANHLGLPLVEMF